MANKPVKVVFDTNIYISAILFGGTPKKLILLALEGKLKLFISDEILSEITSVLAKKFNFPYKQTVKAEDLIKQMASFVKPQKTLNIIKECIPDNRILECAEKAKADYLVSGDKKHILPLKKIGKTKIVSPEEFLKTFS